MKQEGYDMLYLSACALNDVTPDSVRIEHMNLEKLYQMCKFHSLTAIVCMALESAGVCDKQFIEAKSKAIRKNILLDAECRNICEFMEKNGIWHMPLKGAVLKDIYPKLGMRQMSDNDILYDKAYQNQLLSYMKQCGYSVEEVGTHNHDTYMKSPVYNFEMHRSLFSDDCDKDICNYYSDTKSRLIKDEGKEYSYHFTDEDFYVYMTVHEYKHYTDGGTGLRSLMDSFVFLREKGSTLDYDYIRKQLDMMGISEYEQRSRELGRKIFSSPDLPLLSDEEKSMLDIYLCSGTYGTQKRAAQSRVEKFQDKTGSKSKARYIFRRIFPDMEVYRIYFPFFYRHKWLLPVGWLYRLFRGIFFRRSKIKADIDTIKKMDTK